ncbi:hypothetical protein AAF712_006634 [Marasmius tenuissimus]|uniref:Uncharacterized protein n=1 Tax=Marasmius tenuissimus TaxID=585030 RepID=A0ABR2ZXH0_9AGAR
MFFLLLSATLTCSAQAATVTFKDVSPTEATTVDRDPPFSDLVSYHEAGVKTGSDGSAETTYVEEIHNSQELRVSGTTVQVVPLILLAHSQTITDGATITTTQVNYRTCSLVEDGKYGCVWELPLGPSQVTTTYTNTAFDFVVTDVVAPVPDNGVTVGSPVATAWQIVFVLSTMLIGALGVIY